MKDEKGTKVCSSSLHPSTFILPPSVRPLHLLPVPVEVRATAAPSHDGEGPPASFVAPGGCVHRVAHVSGPERIAGVWWEGHHKTRDYYEVEDTTSRRFWVFRVVESGRWFLHGEYE